jgi:endonuclease/exonuclease/phosphatase family metal-dependent hydrolase
VHFTVATYNIHKGFSQLARRMVIHELKARLHGLAADVLFLQEVLGVHDRHAVRYREWPGRPQHEFIADAVWREVAYGKNAEYEHGHHGNALLSRFTMLQHENVDISAHAFESRGMLHCELQLGPALPRLHCIIVHLGLFERGRQWQINALVDRIRDNVPGDEPLIIAGDFNDWRRKANRALCEELGVVEVFEQVTGRPARTFPSMLPVFCLDRIYSRGLNVQDARVHYAHAGTRMSDHAALAATFEIVPRRALAA